MQPKFHFAIPQHAHSQQQQHNSFFPFIGITIRLLALALLTSCAIFCFYFYFTRSLFTPISNSNYYAYTPLTVMKNYFQKNSMIIPQQQQQQRLLLDDSQDDSSSSDVSFHEKTAFEILEEKIAKHVKNTLTHFLLQDTMQQQETEDALTIESSSSFVSSTPPTSTTISSSSAATLAWINEFSLITSHHFFLAAVSFFETSFPLLFATFYAHLLSVITNEYEKNDEVLRCFPYFSTLLDSIEVWYNVTLVCLYPRKLDAQHSVIVLIGQVYLRVKSIMVVASLISVIIVSVMSIKRIIGVEKRTRDGNSEKKKK